MKSSAKHHAWFTPPVAALMGATLIGVSLGACTVSVGEGDPNYDWDTGRRDTSTTPTPTPVGNVACNSCLFQGCSGQHAVCQGNSECLAIYQCATKAGCDQACVNTCFDSHPAGQAQYTALYTCDQQRACESCSSECGVPACAPITPVTPDGGVVEPDASGPLDCSTCTATRCANEQAACGPSSDCDQYSGCVIACGDAACTAACASNHPTGKAASEALALCSGTQCKAECGF